MRRLRPRSSDWPHAERNLSAAEPVEYLVVRSDGERIVEALAITPVADPERQA